MSYGVV